MYLSKKKKKKKGVQKPPESSHLECLTQNIILGGCTVCASSKPGVKKYTGFLKASHDVCEDPK